MQRLETTEDVSELFDELYPLCRSILGEGYRESLEILKRYIPFDKEHFYTGEKILNWEIPKEWVIREAWIKDEYGNKVLDFKDNNLHVVNYSESVDRVITLDELKKHLYTSGADENAIPYTTSYYKKRWGFCLSKKQLMKLEEGNYHVYIGSDFVDGSLVIGDTVLRGKSSKEIFITSYLCHPSMANNELSGPIVLAMLYQRIKKWKNREFSYRFLINPETIGSIAYLSRFGKKLKNKIYAGFVLTCLGGEDRLRYKLSKREDSTIDKLFIRMNEEESESCRIELFRADTGSDERQYCSPGFDMPIGQIARKVYGTYKEYHTSLDNKELMGIDNIIESCGMIENILLRHEKEFRDLESKHIKYSNNYNKKEGNLFYKNLYPYGEVKLGDYNLYPMLNTNGARKEDNSNLIDEPWFISSVMTILSYSDGECSLEYCAKRLNIELDKLIEVVNILIDRGLLKEIG